MKVLVDTSIWSEALRRARRAESGVVREFRSLILEHRVEIIGPIRQEVLSGAREASQFERLEKHLAAFPDLSLAEDDYITAAKYFNLCRAGGIQGSNTDFLICAVAARRQLAIYTTDRDFELFVKRLPIVLHQARGFEPGESGSRDKPRRCCPISVVKTPGLRGEDSARSLKSQVKI